MRRNFVKSGLQSGQVDLGYQVPLEDTFTVSFAAFVVDRISAMI